MYDFSKIDKSFLHSRAAMKWNSDDPAIIPLSLADLDFKAPEFIRKTLHNAVDDDFSPYSQYYGLPGVLSTIQQKLARRNGIPSEIDDIMVVPGTMFALYITTLALLQAGDEVIICPSPVYAPLYLNAQKTGAVIRHCTWSSSNTMENIRNLQSLITPSTRMIMICNPHNPTGIILSREELSQIAGLALENNCILFSDELYEDMCYDSNFCSLGSISPEIRQSSITVYGASKAFAIPGYRVAYLTGGKKIMAKIKSLTPTIIVHTDTLSQAALQATLEQGESWLSELRAHLTVMKDLAVSHLNKIPGFNCPDPRATPFVFPDITNTGYTSDQMTTILKKELKIIVQSGTYFGDTGEGHIRINFATSKDNLLEALGRIASRFS